MNYLKLIQAFWAKHRQEPFTGNETLLYWRLMDLFNAAGTRDEWPETMRFMDPQLCLETGISPNTIDKFRKALVSRQLIEFDPAGKGYRGGGIYKLIAPVSSSKRYANRTSKNEELHERTSNFEEVFNEVPQKDTQIEPQKDTQKLRLSYIYISKPINLQTYQTKTLCVAYRDDGVIRKLIQDQLNEKKKKKPPRVADAPPIFPDSWPQELQDFYLHKWLPFRQSKKRAGKLLPPSIQAQINSLASLTKENAMECMNYSLSNGYTGLIFEKFKSKPNGNAINPQNALNGPINPFGAGAVLPSGASYRKQVIGRSKSNATPT